MARLGEKKTPPKKEEKIVRDDSPVVSAYSEEGKLRTKEAREKGTLKRWEKILIFLGYVLMFVLALVVIYFMEVNGVFGS